MSPTRIAACHVAPVFLSARETTDKAIKYIRQAAENAANVVVFPEAFIPAFPVWSALRPPTENHDLFERMAKESVYADGEEMQALRAVARETQTIISIGFSEKVHFSAACLYNSNILIGTGGEILVHHRKLMPTFYEKLTWSPGDGHGLRVAKTEYGHIGNLICGENTNPLARYSLMAQGEQIHISTWPAIWPTRVSTRESPEENNLPEQERNESGPRNYDNILANRTRAAAHCFEAKCFGVMCAGLLDQRAMDTIVVGSSTPQQVRQALQDSPRGASMFLDPTGTHVPSFTICKHTKDRKPAEALQTEEEILYADLDLDKCIEGKQYHDVVGGYQRLDVFQLHVNRTRQNPVNFSDQEAVPE